MKKQIQISTLVLGIFLSGQSLAMEVRGISFEVPEILSCQIVAVSPESVAATVLDRIQVVSGDSSYRSLPANEPLMRQNTEGDLVRLFGFRVRYDISKSANGFRLVHTERRGVGSQYGQFDVVSTYTCN